MKVSSLKLTLMHIYNNISVRLLNKPIANGSPSIQVNFFSSEDDRCLISIWLNPFLIKLQLCSNNFIIKHCVKFPIILRAEKKSVCVNAPVIW